MDKRTGVSYDVYQMDMYASEDGTGWIENARLLIGSVTLPVTSLEDVTEVMVLKALKKALKKARFTDMTGLASFCPLVTRNRKKVYAEDYYGDGQWWEVGAVKGHCPMYGLSPAA